MSQVRAGCPWGRELQSIKKVVISFAINVNNVLAFASRLSFQVVESSICPVKNIASILVTAIMQFFNT